MTVDDTARPRLKRIHRKPGPPPSTAVVVAIKPEFLARLDAWIAKQPRPMARPKAIRILLDRALILSDLPAPPDDTLRSFLIELEDLIRKTRSRRA